MSSKRNREVLSSSPGKKQQFPDPKQAKNSSLVNSKQVTPKHTINFPSENHFVEMSLSDEALRKQSEYIVSTKIHDFEERITSKIETGISQIKCSIDDVNNRIKTLETKLTEVDVIKKENIALKEQLKQHDDALQQIIARIDRNEELHHYRETESDALIHCLPLLPNENLKLTFNHLFQSLDLKPLNIRDIFRLKTKNETTNPPVIVKFL